MNRIITIGREFGSGGRELGLRLSQRLGIAYYDQEIISEISRRTELSEQYVKKMAEKSDCVIVGRCADYVLKDCQTSRHVFLYAPYDDRIRTVMERYSLDEKKAEQLIRRVDKDRSYYYNYYTDQYWEDMENYDLCLDTAAFDREQLLDILAKVYEQI